MHLTLRFYGDVSEEQVSALCRFLAEQLAPLEAPLLLARGLGAFPSLKRPSILWAGFEILSGDLCAPQQITEEAALEIGLEAEKKPFHPHLTLGRIRNPADAAAFYPLLAPYQEEGHVPEFGYAFNASKVLVIRSQLTPRGPIYTIMREMMLK